MTPPRPWVTFEDGNLRFVDRGLTNEEIDAINDYIKMVYRDALKTGPIAGAINLANLELRSAEVSLRKDSQS